MRGLLLHPAKVTVALVFDDSISEDFFHKTCEQWGSLAPTVIAENAETWIEENPQKTVWIAPDGAIAPQGIVHELRVAREDAGYERLTVEVTLRMLEQLAGDLHLLHAAALGDFSTHQAMILIGPSGRGKTTAAKFLGQHFAYLSDETAVVQHDGTVRPYPKPLSLITAVEQPKQQMNPAKLGMQSVAATDFSYSLQHVILLDRQPERTAAPTLERVHLADALLEIVQQTSGLLRGENGVVDLIELLKRCGGALRLSYRDVEDTLPLFPQLFAGTVVQPEQIETQYERTEWEQEGVASLNAGLLCRIPGSTAFLLGERWLLSIGERLIEISPFSAEIWLELREPLSPQNLKDRLEESFAHIPQNDFERVIGELKTHRIIR